MPRITMLVVVILIFSMDLFGQAGSRRNQPEVFGFGIVAGVNNSQLDGDYFTGFNKTGFYGGLRGVVILAPRLALNVELLYSVKGSKIEHSGALIEFAPRDRLIDLSYAEVPLFSV